MKIAVYNLRNLFGPGTYKVYDEQVVYSSEFVQQRVNHAVRIISKLGADVIIVNEIGSSEILATIAQQLSGDYLSHMANPGPRGIGNGVIYKVPEAVCESVPVVSTLPVFHTGDQEAYAGQLRFQRDLVHLTTTYASQPLHVFGLHFKSSLPTPLKDSAGKEVTPNIQVEAGDGLARSAIRRLGEARALRTMIDNVFSHDKNAQVIIAGDFNDTERSAVVRMVQGESESLLGRLTNLCGLAPEDRRYTVQSEDGHKQLIDHILVSQSLLAKVIGIEIDNKNLHNEEEKFKPTEFIESDHAPIVVEFK